MSEEYESQDRTVSAPGEGVGGWLLVLCIVLTIGTPFVAAHNLISNYQQASSEFEYVRGLEEYLFFVTGLRLFLVIFSMHAGISLWTERVHAVRTAKLYLWLFLTALMAGIVMLFVMVDWPEERMETLLREVAIEVGQSLIFFAVCYLYLTRSKRVKATYLFP